MQTPTVRPRFRTDLVAEPIEEGGHRYIDVVDPDTGNGFRFYDVEYSLACAMDGERDVEGLVVWAKEELGIDPEPAELAQVISTLDTLGYLATGEAAAAGADTELAPGVITAGRQAPPPLVEDVELGYAGGGSGPGAADQPIHGGDFELGFGGGAPAGRAQEPPVGGPELGASGASSGSSSGREIVMEFEAPTPPPAEMPYATMRPSMTRPDAEDDGPTNLPSPATTADFDEDEVSVDLSDHLAISASDVKEAVRASKVMKAVELPADLQAQLDSSERDLAAARENAERVATARASAREVEPPFDRIETDREVAERRADDRDYAQHAESERAAGERADERAAERATGEAGRPPVELPKQPPVGVSRPRPGTDRPVDGSVDKPAVVAKEPAPAPQRSRATFVLLLLILLVAAAGGAWYYQTQVLKKPLPWEKADDTAAGPTGGTASPTGGTAVATGGTAAATGAEVVPPPPPPAPPSATLASASAPPAEVAAGQAAVVAFVAVQGSTVAAGDALVRFAGNPAWEQKLVGLNYDIDLRVPKQLADATAKRDAAQTAGKAAAVKQQQQVIDERTKRLEQKQSERAEILAAQEALTVKAPIAGVVDVKVAKGARTKADQVVAVVTPAAQLQATFTLPEGAKVPAADASVRVAVKAAPDQKANCTVTAVEGKQVTVTCPGDGEITADTEIILE